jgi:dTDP-4-dehydrorhamnose 3,5-epimerase
MSESNVEIEPLQVTDLPLSGIRLFHTNPQHDHRGIVTQTYNKLLFDRLGIAFDVIHENWCWSPLAGTIRGFHYQRPPHGQTKLVQVIKGRILDVVVDLRRSSPTFGRHIKTELSASTWSQIFVPEGFAHCYCTLDPDTVAIFKLGASYSPAYATGLAWNDPDLNIDWSIDESSAIVLERDLQRPRFRDLTEFFP